MYKIIVSISFVTCFLMSFISTLDVQADQKSMDYLKVVQQYAEMMLEKGRDRYGKIHTPLFAATLDRNTMALPEGETLKKIQNLERGEWGIRKHDRMITGANPMHDQNLYQILYALTKITGDKRYAVEADQTLKWFWEHCQSKNTGLMAWGEHIGWDFYTETIIKKSSGTTHEYFRPWIFWDKCYALAPQACEKFALGVWEHQIGDQETGNFSRHANYEKHEPGKNSEYPRHGGFYIATWAYAYKITQKPIFLEAIETVFNYYEGRRSSKTGAIPFESHARSKGNQYVSSSNLSLAIDLHTGAAWVPEKLGRKMKSSAVMIDKVFLKLEHDLGEDGIGFLKFAQTHTLQPGDIRTNYKKKPTGIYTQLWTTGYGDQTTAMMANLCLERYRQVKNPEYKKVILAAAKGYLNTEPDTTFPVYPGTLGHVILILLGAHELTGETCYLDRADYYAQQSIQVFLKDGGAVPKASSKHNHYEAITSGDTLMMAILKLWTIQNQYKKRIQLIFTDR